MSKVIEAIQKCDPITEESFHEFCVELHRIDKLYHFEDNPFDITSIKGERVFTDEEADALSLFLKDAWSKIKDPMQHVLDAANLED